MLSSRLIASPLHLLDCCLVTDGGGAAVLTTLERAQDLKKAPVEDLGFCKKGEGGAFVAGQRTAPGGEFPLNTQGGGLSYCHPGVFGIFTLIEGVRQLRGECGPRQVKDARVALCHGTGGVLSSSGTAILGRLQRWQQPGRSPSLTPRAASSGRA